MELWSTAFLHDTAAVATASGEGGLCHVDIATWRDIQEENFGAKRLFARIKLGEGGGEAYCALGAPVAEEAAARLYCPVWLLDKLDTEGVGEEAEVTWLSEEAFPEATRIVLRPHDSAFYHADAKEELERELTRQGLVSQGDTIFLPVSALGGYCIALDVVLTEPANIVLAEGEEVAVEFEEALDAVRLRSTAPAPPAAAMPEPEQTMHSMLPEQQPLTAPAPPSSGNILGGAPVRHTVDGKPWNPWRDSARV